MMDVSRAGRENPAERVRMVVDVGCLLSGDARAAVLRSTRDRAFVLSVLYGEVPLMKDASVRDKNWLYDALMTKVKKMD